jgi:hypothetical protein
MLQLLSPCQKFPIFGHVYCWEILRCWPPHINQASLSAQTNNFGEYCYIYCVVAARASASSCVLALTSCREQFSVVSPLHAYSKDQCRSVVPDYVIFPFVFSAFAFPPGLLGLPAAAAGRWRRGSTRQGCAPYSSIINRENKGTAFRCHMVHCSPLLGPPSSRAHLLLSIVRRAAQ